jgi:hypothetical protein
MIIDWVLRLFSAHLRLYRDSWLIEWVYVPFQFIDGYVETDDANDDYKTETWTHPKGSFSSHAT